MAVELTANAIQTVAIGQNVLFTENPVPCTKNYVIHRNGSGIATLRGITNNCKARYKVTYSGNITVATGGTLGEVSVALSINGEALASSIRRVTPAAIGDYFAVSATEIIDVPKCCCLSVSIENTSETAIDTHNVSMIIERIA